MSADLVGVCVYVPEVPIAVRTYSVFSMSSGIWNIFGGDGPEVASCIPRKMARQSAPVLTLRSTGVRCAQCNIQIALTQYGCILRLSHELGNRVLNRNVLAEFEEVIGRAAYKFSGEGGGLNVKKDDCNTHRCHQLED